VKREAVIAGLASEGLALILGSAGAGSSAFVGPMPKDPVEFRKCARDLKALSAGKDHTIEERGGSRDPGVRRPSGGVCPASPQEDKAFLAHFCTVYLFPVPCQKPPTNPKTKNRKKRKTNPVTLKNKWE